MNLPKEVKFTSQEEADLFLESLGAKHIAGLDEVGRGAYSGNVVVAIVLLHPNHGIEGIKDSKKLSVKKREVLAEQIMERSWWNIGVRDNIAIDSYNIREATLQAAVAAVVEQSIRSDAIPFDFLLCDGGLHIRDQLNAYSIGPTVSVVKGDQWYECIGAASIVAKVHRDAQMSAYHEVWPEYGFKTNQGYGTAYHIAAIEKYGITSIHRRSFKPIRDYLKRNKKLKERK